MISRSIIHKSKIFLTQNYNIKPLGFFCTESPKNDLKIRISNATNLKSRWVQSILNDGILFEEQYKNSSSILPQKRLNFDKDSKWQLIYSFNDGFAGLFKNKTIRNLLYFSPWIYCTLYQFQNTTFESDPYLQTINISFFALSTLIFSIFDKTDSDIVYNILINKHYKDIVFVKSKFWFESSKSYTTLDQIEISNEECKKHKLPPRNYCIHVPRENIIWSGWKSEYNFLVRIKEIEMLQKEDNVYDEAEERFERNYKEKFVKNMSPVSMVVYYCEKSNKIKKQLFMPYRNKVQDTYEYVSAIVENRKVDFLG